MCPPPLPGRALNHAEPSVQTDAPLSETLSSPGRPAAAGSISRRNFLMATTTAVAASAVVASPSIASEIVPSATTWPADAELLRLGAEFDAVKAERDASDDDVAKRQKTLFQETIARRGDLGSGDAIMLERWESSGLRAAERRYNALADRLEDVYGKILATPAAGFAGVAVKMRVLRWFLGADDQGDRRDQDLPDEWFNTIDEEIRRLAGEDVSRSVSTFGAPSLTEPVPERDPIFAAIENHRHACLGLFALEGDDDDEERRAAHDHMDDKAIELTNVRPTTMAGILTLLTYVHHVNTGKVHLPGHPDRYTEEEFWPGELVDDDIQNPRGRVLALPFPYWVMENIRAAMLETPAIA